MNNNKRTISFFALTETHLNDSILDAEINIENYEVLRSDRIERKQGGVALYLHHTLSIDESKKFSDKYTEAIMTFLKKSNIVIIIAYRAPNTPVKSFKNMIDTVKTFCKEHERSDILVLGDFNFRFLN